MAEGKGGEEGEGVGDGGGLNGSSVQKSGHLRSANGVSEMAVLIETGSIRLGGPKSASTGHVTHIFFGQMHLCKDRNIFRAEKYFCTKIDK